MPVPVSKIKFDSDGFPIPQKVAADPSVKFDDEGLPIPIKKKETSPSTGIVSVNGTKTTATPLSDLGIGSKQAVATGLFSTLAPTSKEANAVLNYQNKKLTEDDVTILANIDFGKEKGLATFADSPDAKKYFVTAHNGIKQSDIINSINEYLPGGEEGKQLRGAILNGDLNAIKSLKGSVKDKVQKKIDDISAANIVAVEGYLPQPLSKEQQNQIKELNGQIEKAENVIDEYARISIVNKFREPDGTIKSSSFIAKDIGKELEEYGLAKNKFKQRENVVTATMSPELQKKLDKIKKEAPVFANKINDQINQMQYGSENINYDREKSGNAAILQALDMEANDLVAKGMTSGDPALLQKADDVLNNLTYVKDRDKRLLDKYPDVGITQTARVLSDRISKDNIMRPFVTDIDIYQAAQAEEKENPGFLDTNGKFINYVTPSMLPKGGLIGNLELGIEAVGNDLFGSGTDFEKVARSYNPALKTTSQSGGEATKIVYDKEGKTYRELQNENYGTWDFNNAVRVIGHGAPELAKFVLLEKGFGALAGITSEIGGGVLAKIAQTSSKLSKAPVTAEELVEAQKVFQLSKGLQETLGLTGAMYQTGYEQNRELADELIEGDSGKDEFKKDVLANAMTLLSVAAFRTVGFSPTKTIEKSFAKGIMPDAIKLLEKGGFDSPEIAEGFFKDVVIPKAQAVLTATGQNIKGGIKGAEAMVLDENVKGILASIVNPEKGHLPSLQEDADIAISQILLMTAVGLPGIVGAETKSTLTKDAMYEAGLRHPQFEDMITKARDQGTYTEQQANEMIATLKTMGEEAYKVQDQRTENGLPLTVKQKRDISFNNFRSRAAKMLQEKGYDVNAEKIISETEKQNAEIKNNARFQPVAIDQDGKIIEEKPTATTIEEPLLIEAEKKAIEVIKEKDFESGFIKTYADVIKDENSTPQEKRDALKAISDQLTDPNTAETVDKQLKGAADAIYDLNYPKTEPIDFSREEKPQSSISVNMPGELKAPDIVPLKKTDETVTQEPIKTNEPIPAETTQPATGEPNQTGEAAGGGEKPPISEPPKGGAFVERPATELSHRGLQVVSNEFSLPDVTSRERKTDIQLRQDARETTDKWAESGQYAKNVEGLVSKAEDGEILTDEQRVILEQHLANISDELRNIQDKNSPEFDAKLAEVKRLKDAGELTRSEAGAALRVPLGGSRPKDIADFLIEEMDASGVDKLTEDQKSTAVKEFENITEAQNKYDEKIAALEAENARLKAEAELKKSPKPKGEKKDYAAERKQIFEDIREKLKKARGETSVTILPYANELIAIAPDVAKLVKNLIGDGVTKLGEIVDNIHENLKEVIPSLTKKDVHDIIAGEYNQKKETKNELSRQLYELKQQAMLVNKLEKLQAGEEPKNNIKAIKRNNEITELRKQIKEHDLTKLSDYKKRTQSQIDKVENDLKEGNFSEQTKKTELPPLDKEAKDLRDSLIKLKQQREIRLLTEEYKNRSKYEKTKDYLIDKLNIPRTIMASMDYSAPLRQGIVAAVSHPRTAALAQIEAFKSSFSQKHFDRFFYDIKENPRYEVAVKSGLAISDPHSPFLTAKEEAFMNNTAEKIPVVGELIKGSERAYVMFLNKMRWDLFNRFIDRLEEQGKTLENSKRDYEATAGYINNTTGRGDLGKLQNYAPILNTIFFAPRLIASRLNLLNPVYYAKLPKHLRVMAAKDMFKFIALGTTVLALAKLNGAQVEDDPRSSDFGKIRQGNTRWDIWGGFQPYIRMFTQVASGQRKSSNTGKIKELNGKGAFGSDRADVLKTFFRGKLAPVPSMGVDLLSGRNTAGQPVTLKSEAQSHLLPLIYTDIKQAYDDKGVRALWETGLPSIFGVGVQTYQKVKK